MPSRSGIHWPFVSFFFWILIIAQGTCVCLIIAVIPHHSRGPGHGNSVLYIPIVTTLTGGSKKKVALSLNVIMIQQPLIHTFHAYNIIHYTLNTSLSKTLQNIGCWDGSSQISRPRLLWWVSNGSILLNLSLNLIEVCIIQGMGGVLTPARPLVLSVHTLQPAHPRYYKISSLWVRQPGSLVMSLTLVSHWSPGTMRPSHWTTRLLMGVSLCLQVAVAVLPVFRQIFC